MLLLLNTVKAAFCSVQEDDFSLVIYVKEARKEGRTNTLETVRKGYIQWERRHIFCLTDPIFCTLFLIPVQGA